jgi:hypothetical protein
LILFMLVSPVSLYSDRLDSRLMLACQECAR